MARKTSSRREKRKEAEAAEAAGDGKKETAKTTKKKTSRKKKSSRSKSKATERKKLVWAVYSGTMKEEARFPYDQRKEAEEKLEQLRNKTKKLYFIQPIKEPITETPAEDG